MLALKNLVLATALVAAPIGLWGCSSDDGNKTPGMREAAGDRDSYGGAQEVAECLAGQTKCTCGKDCPPGSDEGSCKDRADGESVCACPENHTWNSVTAACNFCPSDQRMVVSGNSKPTCVDKEQGMFDACTQTFANGTIASRADNTPCGGDIAGKCIGGSCECPRGASWDKDASKCTCPGGQPGSKGAQSFWDPTGGGVTFQVRDMMSTDIIFQDADKNWVVKTEQFGQHKLLQISDDDPSDPQGYKILWRPDVQFGKSYRDAYDNRPFDVPSELYYMMNWSNSLSCHPIGLDGNYDGCVGMFFTITPGSGVCTCTGDDIVDPFFHPIEGCIAPGGNK